LLNNDNIYKYLKESQKLQKEPMNVEK